MFCLQTCCFAILSTLRKQSNIFVQAMSSRWADDEHMGYDIDDGPDGDYDEDEFTNAPPRDEILETTETEADENGIKTIVEIRQTPEGKKIKKITKVKVIRKEKKVNPKIEARNKIPKYGAAKYHVKVTSESVPFEYVKNAQSAEENKLLELKKNQLLNLGEKLTYKAQTKTTSILDSIKTGGKYQAPGMKNKSDEAGSRGDGPRRFDRDEFPTVRVSNIYEEASDYDIRSIFQNIGAVKNVHLARDRETGETKGFAYVSFYEKKHAEEAIAKLNGYKLEYLLLSVEWAKPQEK